IRSCITKIKDFKELSVLLVLVLVSVLLSITTDSFATSDNLGSLAIGLSCDGIIAIGMTTAMIGGGFDLSVGGIFGLSAAIAALLTVAGVNIWLAVIIALAVCVVVGLINGLLISKVGVNPFITTLGMMSITRGLVLVLTDARSVSIVKIPDIASFRVLGTGDFLSIPIIVIAFILMGIIGDIVVKKTTIALQLFYVGSNEKAARLSGINVDKVKTSIYMITAFMAAIAGVLSLSRFGVATALGGQGAEMRVVSATVIGGASLKGGKGSVLGAILGIVLLNVVNNGLVLLSISVYWQSVISGLILIIAVSIDTLSTNRKNSK
ncbi:MAG TPA: ABC transporter permease, partial [Negativicutes bacterium]|nr:ABC transporter permease [Negativicutes bacterium]